MTRRFHVGDILSVTTGVLVSPRGMDGVHDIIEFMVGDGPMGDLGITIARRACMEALVQQHPGLSEIDADTELEPDTVPGWLAMQVDRFGETLPVSPLSRSSS